MKFCSNCGQPIEIRIPDGDHLPRYCCPACGSIHYQNPRIISACIPQWGDRILLCRRAIEPRKGYWTLPAGFMEIGETVSEAAARETREETNAQVEVGDLFAIFNLPHIAQVYMVHHGQLLTPEYSTTAESSEVCLVRESEIPWSELAFETMRRSLTYFFEDRAAGAFQFRTETIHGQRKDRNSDSGWLD